ncbi:MAG: MobC family plasmid mobilization relaxosome protein [Burkholderiales bacterium]|nr:MobC family plasmid mobilization relaxosome protein [Burkholderiales bacterium]
MSKLTKDIKFRISEEDYLIYLDKVKKSGFNRSEFFRNIVLKNKTKVVNKNDAIEVIYHLNKMGNNLNQIAYKLNKAFLENKITHDVFDRNLFALNKIIDEQKNIIDLLLYAKDE